MIWSFLWRFVVFGWTFALAATFVAGFFLELAAVPHSTAREIGTVVQVIAVLLAAASAYVTARDAHPKSAARQIV